MKICKKTSITWQTITEMVISHKKVSETLSEYIKENDVIYLNCYNTIIINKSFEFKQHVLEQHYHNELETFNNDILSFS